MVNQSIQRVGVSGVWGGNLFHIHINIKTLPVFVLCLRACLGWTVQVSCCLSRLEAWNEMHCSDDLVGMDEAEGIWVMALIEGH
jgi:hypothetical protein